MKIGLVGGSYQDYSLPFNAERSVNLYPVFDKNGKEVAALYGTPGLSLFTTAGTGYCRGSFASANGRGFIISGSILYEIDSVGNITNRGSLLQNTGNVTIAENPFELAICDGSNLYILNYATNVFGKVTDVDLPTSGTVAFIDGYFIVNKVDTGSFYISGLNDGTSWDALDFATAESSPDPLKRVYNALGQLWLFGSITTEIWTNTGSSVFPFQKISGGKLEVGIMSPYAIVTVDNAIIWLGQDDNGGFLVYKTTSVVPSVISPEPINMRFAEATNPEEIVAFIYQEQAHTFVVFTGGGLETSLVYDVDTEIWHERAYLNQDGDFELHLANCCMSIFNKILVGSRRDGKIYEMSMSFYDDDGDALLRERVYTHLFDENKRVRYNNLNIGFETGVGLQTGQGQNPIVALQLSKDGARTWSTTYTTSIGAVGDYRTQVNFRRLGVAQQMTFKIRISDPVKIAICGSYLT